ncbi:hypothetical protein PPSIR1_38494 [Plesiocystis pacifica SIR-1]|uniref:Uncharacterized protein n=2 Tax=Plesiocystis pacifica TaxID=191768 RepID=A6G8M2_9BACT|nr:hypothetical protein PPSIR1_38494 [Plesiocystis pacifica SIR-1]
MPSAMTLAETAHRCALIQVVRQSPTLGLDQLLRLASEGQHAATLSSICVGELVVGSEHALPEPLAAEPLEKSMLRVFQASPERRFPASTITRHLGLRRWTTLKVLGPLMAEGKIQRAGRTSSTRYWLASS